MKTGLVIEDNEDNMVLITRLLQKFGFQMLQAQTGMKGYEMAYAMAGDRERLLAAGCDGYIEKPFDPKCVVSQIRKLIGEK